MRHLAAYVVTALLIGCAHGPHAESPAAAPGDDRAVVVLLTRSSEFCDECRELDAKLAHEAVAPALARVRLVRYAVDSFSGSEAFERLLGSRVPLEPPLLLGVVDEHVARGMSGVPSSLDTLRAFLDEVASLGGDGAEYAAVAAGADAAPDVLLRAAHWHDARRHDDVALALWQRLGARDDAPLDARAEADWSVARAERKREPWQARAALDFAGRHPATFFGWHALVYAAASGKVASSEVAAVLRRDYEAAAPLGRGPVVVYVALAVGTPDLARELARSLGRDGHAATPDELMAVAEVEFAFGHRDQAVALAERALAAAPTASAVRAAIERYRSRREVSPFVRALVVSALHEQLRVWMWR